MASSIDIPAGNNVTSSHRLPTISATQALQEENQIQRVSISLGLAALDQALNAGNDGPGGGSSGLRHGAVTEICGPPGSGKTALCIQGCVSALRSGGRVLWLDCCTCVSGDRIKEAILVYEEDDTTNETTDSLLGRVTHYLVSSLAELIAILPALETHGRGTNLIIIDSISTLFDEAFLRTAAQTEPNSKNDNHRLLASRKATVTGELADRLAHAATVTAIPILITCNMVTRLRGEGPAVLRTSMSGQAWENSIHARVLICRDWAPVGINQDGVVLPQGSILRYASVTRYADAIGRGYASYDPTESVPFYISKRGVHELAMQVQGSILPSTPTWSRVSSKKRTYAEVADSEDGASDPELEWEQDVALDYDNLVAEEPHESISSESARSS